MPYSPLPRQIKGVSQQHKDKVKLWLEPCGVAGRWYEPVCFFLKSCISDCSFCSKKPEFFSRWINAIVYFDFHCVGIVSTRLLDITSLSAHVCALTHLPTKIPEGKGWGQRQRCRPTCRRQACKCGCSMSRTTPSVTDGVVGTQILGRTEKRKY